MALKLNYFIRVTIIPFCCFFLNGCSTLGEKNILLTNDQANMAYIDGNTEMAIKYYTIVTKESPDDGIAWSRLGSLYAISRDTNKSVDALNKASLLLPNDAAVFYNLGYVKLLQSATDLSHAYQVSNKDKDDIVFIKKILDQERKIISSLSSKNSRKDSKNGIYNK